MQINAENEEFLALGVTLYCDKSGTDVAKSKIGAHIICLPFN